MLCTQHSAPNTYGGYRSHTGQQIRGCAVNRCDSITSEQIMADPTNKEEPSCQ